MRPKIHKLCVVRTYEDMNELLITTNEVGKVLGKIGGTLFEPLKDEKEKEIAGREMFTNRQLHVLSKTLIFFQQIDLREVNLSLSSKNLNSCQQYQAIRHIIYVCFKFTKNQNVLNVKGGIKQKTMVLNVPTILVWDTQRNDAKRRIEMASLLHQTSWKS